MYRSIYLDAFYKAELVHKKQYSKGEGQCDYIELIVTSTTGNYDNLEALRNLRGKRKGKIILKLCSKDYTNEHERRKAYWKLASRLGHISKVTELGNNKAWIDFIGTNDAAYLIVNEDWSYEGITEIKLFIAKGKKNDKGFLQMFESGEFDEEIQQIEEEAYDEE